jgi:hypothetical protein
MRKNLNELECFLIQIIKLILKFSFWDYFRGGKDKENSIMFISPKYKFKISKK